LVKAYIAYKGATFAIFTMYAESHSYITTINNDGQRLVFGLR